MLSFIHQNYYKSISLQDIDESGNMTTSDISTETTNENGIITEQLQYDTLYRITETQAPYGYVLDDKLLLPLFCVGVEHVRTPRTYYSVCDGICFDEEKNIVDLKNDNFNGGGVQRQ